MPCIALVCTLVVASASAHTAGAIYHRSKRARLAHGHQISLLAQGEGQQQQQASDSYCISMDGQTMVDDKWCVVSCSNIPPNCPADLCDCVTGSEAKKRYDTVQEALKNATKTKEEVPAVLGAGGNKGEVMNGTAEEAGQLAGTPTVDGDQTVHREQAVHQRELKQGDGGYLEAAKRSADPSPPKSAAEVKWDQQAASWAVRDSPPPTEEANSSPLQAGNASAENATTLKDAPMGDLAEMVKRIAEGVAAQEAAKEAAKEASNATQEEPMATPVPESSDISRRPMDNTPKNYSQQAEAVLTGANAAAAEAEIYPLPKNASSAEFKDAATGIKDVSTGFKAEEPAAAGASKSSSQQGAAAAAGAPVSAELSAEAGAAVAGSPPHMVQTAAADGEHDDGAGVISPDAGPKPEGHPAANKGWFLSSLPAPNAKDEQEKDAALHLTPTLSLSLSLTLSLSLSPSLPLTRSLSLSLSLPLPRRRRCSSLRLPSPRRRRRSSPTWLGLGLGLED